MNPSLQEKENNNDLPENQQDSVAKYRTILKSTISCTLKVNKITTKLLARQRINLLIDEASEFIEFSALAAYNQYDNQFPSAGIITGIGTISGKQVVIVSNDSAVKGGTYIKETIKKHLRAQEIALTNNLPCLYIVDSGGIFLPEQAAVFPDKEGFGRIFFNQAQMSAKGIPQISLVVGSCTAGGAYIPAMSDEVIMVKNQATIFLAGPPLVKAATGEDVTAEELGGAYVHTHISGVADHFAESEMEAVLKCKDIFKTLPSSNDLQKLECYPEPKSSVEELNEFSELVLQGKVSVYEIIERVVDAQSFNEFKANYGATLVTGFAQVKGKPIAIIANNGILFSESAQKGAHFIQLCNSRKIPMLFLQNITGFMVGKEYEHRGIAKDGAKMVNALSNSTVPFFTIIIGGSYGAGNYAMAGRAFNPNFLFLWPNASISVMGPSQAADVLVSVNRKLTTDEERVNYKEIIKKQYLEEASPYYSTSRLWDDGIIEPSKSREVVSFMLKASENQLVKSAEYGVFRF